MEEWFSLFLNKSHPLSRNTQYPSCRHHHHHHHYSRQLSYTFSLLPIVYAQYYGLPFSSTQRSPLAVPCHLPSVKRQLFTQKKSRSTLRSKEFNCFEINFRTSSINYQIMFYLSSSVQNSYAFILNMLCSSYQ